MSHTCTSNCTTMPDLLCPDLSAAAVAVNSAGLIVYSVQWLASTLAPKYAKCIKKKKS